MISTLFTVCQHQFLFSRYVSPKLGPVGPNSRILYTFLLKNPAQNEHKIATFYPIFSIKTGLCVVFPCNSISWSILWQKKSPKVPRQHFSAFFRSKNAENWPKYREFPLFLQNARYLKITARTFSEARNVRLT